MPVYKKNDKWYARINYVDSNGNYKSKQSKYFATKREASVAEAQLKNDPVATASLMTFDVAFDEYLKYQKDKVKISVYAKYPELYKYIKTGLGSKKIETLTIQQYTGFKEELTNMGLSLDRRNKVHKFVISLVKFTEKIFDVKTTVPQRCGGFSDPNAQKKEMKFYTLDQFRKFIEVVDGWELPEYSGYFRVLYYQGLRKGECSALTWKDIDFERKEINVNKTLLTKIKGEKYIVTSPKTPTSNRVLPMTDEVLGVLRPLYEKAIKYKNFKDSWFVFGGITPICDTSITNHKNSACDSAGLERIRIHDFRHSFASLMISVGCQPVVLSKLMGHASVNITLSTYTHMYPNQLSDAVSRLDQYLKATNIRG